MGGSLLKVEGLAVNLGGQPILQSVTFEVREGERLGLIGPNGAGKTTLLEALAGLLPFAGGKLTHQSPLFYLPDGITPWADLRAGELLLTIQHHHHRVDGDRKGLIDELDLAPMMGKRMSELSKGNRKRVLLAMAFLTTAKLLLLDEPFDGLDIHQARRAMNLIQSYQAAGRTFLLSIHELRQAEGLCERFLLLVGGELVATGTLQELRELTGTVDGLEEVFLAIQ